MSEQMLWDFQSGGPHPTRDTKENIKTIVPWEIKINKKSMQDCYKRYKDEKDNFAHEVLLSLSGDKKRGNSSSGGWGGETKATSWGSSVTCGPESRLRGKSELPGVIPQRGKGQCVSRPVSGRMSRYTSGILWPIMFCPRTRRQEVRLPEWADQAPLRPSSGAWEWP